jgi:hypothetical protein
MTRIDDRLDIMIGRLVQMDKTDQAYVLDRLDPDHRARLQPMLTRVQPPGSVSPGLQKLWTAIVRGQQPQSMTPKAVAALRSLTLPIGPNPDSSSRDPGGLTARVSAIRPRGTQ